MIEIGKIIWLLRRGISPPGRSLQAQGTPTPMGCSTTITSNKLKFNTPERDTPEIKPNTREIFCLKTTT